MTRLSYETKMLEDRARFVRMAGLKKGSRVLDAGTGHGLLAKCIAPKVGKNGLIVAVDISSNHVKQANTLFKKERLSDFVHVIKADLRWVPISSNTLDVVLSYNFFCSINVPSDMPKVLSDAKRILRKNGRIIAVDYVSKSKSEHENLYFRRFDVYKKVYMYIGNSLHLTFFTGKEIKSLLETLGFVVKIKIIKRDIWMPKRALKKEVRDLVQKIRQKAIDKKVTSRLIDELRELYKKTEKQGIKVPAALFMIAELVNDVD